MPKRAETYTITSELQRSGSRYFRINYRDPESRKRSRVPTGILDDGGKNSRIQVEKLALKLASENFASLLPRPVVTLAALSKDFWNPERSEFLQERLLRDPDAVGPEQINNMASMIRNHLPQELANMELVSIRPRHIEAAVTLLLKKGLAHQTVRHFTCALRQIFQWAVNKDLLEVSPMGSLRSFRIKRTFVRGTFSQQEISRLLDWNTATETWAPKVSLCRKKGTGANYHPTHSPYRFYAVAILCALLGARVGSIVCLRREDISVALHNGTRYLVVEVMRTVTSRGGIRKGTKTGSGTRVPLAPELLEPVLEHLPKSGPLFPSRGKTGVVSTHAANQALHSAMERMGIALEQQAERHLSCHTWRHTWVTNARRARLGFAFESGFTEHRESRTGDRYTHLEPSDLLDALPFQRRLVGAS